MAKRRNTSEVEMNSYKRIRTVCFSQLTRMAEDLEENGDSLNINEISIKLSLLENYFVKFDTEQTAIERIDIENESEYRHRFEGPATAVISSLECSETNFTEALDLLKKRYDNKRLIFTAHINKILNLPQVSRGSAASLREFFDILKGELRALQTLGTESEIKDALLINIVASKLDNASRCKWKESSCSNNIPNWDEFVKFFDSRCQMLEHVQDAIQNSHQVDNSHSRRLMPRKHANTLTTDFRKNNCVICHSAYPHPLYKCRKYSQKPIKERINIVKGLGLCMNCLRSNHTLKNCPSSNTCLICSQKHHSSLHVYSNPNYERPATTSTPTVEPNNEKKSNCLSIESYSSSFSEVVIATALVDVVSSTGQTYPCRLLLDSASQTNFITERFANILNLKKFNTDYTILGVNQSRCLVKQKTIFTIKSRVNDYELEVEALILPKITSLHPSSSFDINDWQIPKHIQLADTKFNYPSRIDALLGAEHFLRLFCVGQIDLGPSKPLLQKTLLGWTVSGKLISSSQNDNRTSLQCSSEQYDDLMSLRNIEKLVRKFWELETIKPGIRALSAEEKRCEDFFDQTTYQDDTGRFVVRLPFKEPPNCLGCSFDIAKRRYLNLENKFIKNSQLHDKYKNFIHEYEALDHMEIVDQSTLMPPFYYMPHHGIEQVSNGTVGKKLRVVFDASCKSSSGVALNDILMVGPKVQNELFDVLSRFRTHTYVISADIIKMYRQITVDQNDRKFQLILWRNKPSDPLKTYALNTVTYGTSSAPYLSIKCLKKLAFDQKSTFPVGAEALLRDLYVDDILTGSDSLGGLQKVTNEIIQILKTANMELHKWCTNSKEAFQALEIIESQKFISASDNETVRALGINWNPTTDQFLFRFDNLKTYKKHTKRTILSIVASFFDPLGLINPIVVVAKAFIQKLWGEKLHWDESLPMRLQSEWMQLFDQLQVISEVKIDRFVSIPEALSFQLHAFSDASKTAYGSCIYLRAKGCNNNTSVKLLAAKSRIAPLKTQTIARLELCGAVLMSELVEKVIHALSMQFSDVFCWTDSTITLAWIKAPSSMWNTFVSHRVSQIQVATEKYNLKWRHVPTEFNPADILSHGALPKTLLRSNLWFDGPSFLKSEQTYWPQTTTISNTAEEKRNEEVALLSTQEIDAVRSSKYSNSFRSTRRIFAYVNRFIKNCQSEIVKNKNKSSQLENHFNSNDVTLTKNDLAEAEILIAKLIQNLHYSHEIKALKDGGYVSKTSKILPLSPFLDDEGVLRVGGRLTNSDISYNAKHPKFLPRDHPYTKGLVRDLHETNFHAGALTLCCILRQKYWVPNARQLCRLITRSCIICFHTRPETMKQIMGQLPPNRVTSCYPFLNTGIDFCGPFYLKQFNRGKSSIKAYIALFICLSTKAVHLEVVSNLSTEAFLASLKRFISRRGRCATILSDNATNFVGAKRELKQLHELFISESHQNSLRMFCSEESIDWKFIPPRSPHFGGIWEASIKKAKFHLTRILRGTRVNYEEFTTIVTQIEGVLNSRPLTPISSDPNDLEALTPAHFLIGRSMQSITEPNLTDLKLNGLSKWQHLTFLLQSFWKRWNIEYLTTLNSKNQWSQPKRNINVGELVLLKDENLPPMQWAMGRILNVITGNDGKIRVADVKTRNGTFRRAIHKLCQFPENELKETVEIPSRRGE